MNNTQTNNHKKPKANSWFQSGSRLPYDFQRKKILSSATGTSLYIWNKVISGNRSNWITLMPGFPDGSFGWAATEEYLKSMDDSSRLYVEYVGMGDSDKPTDYPYGIIERADMIEALWKHYKITETTLVTFDFSSLVALELLSRQIDRRNSNEPHQTHINGVLLINGGYFADSHSHPILTTPLLKTVFGRMGTKMAQNSTFAFNMMMKDLWSKDYGVTKEELAENQNAVTRRNGAIFMSLAAGFVDEHKQNASRLDLKRIFKASYPEVKFVVAGSEKDQFEPKQLIKAQKELQHLGMAVERYPGGHMTTSEHPDLIAESVRNLVQRSNKIK